MKKAVFILLFFVGIVFQIAADKQGIPNDTKNADQSQKAGVQAEVSADDKTPAGKETDKNIGGNTSQPQKNESDQAKQKPSAGTLPADPKPDDGAAPDGAQTPVDPTPDAANIETNEQTTVHNTENDSAFDLSPAIETDHRLAKEAKELSQKALSELKQYSRYWDEQYNRMICFVLLSMLVIVIIVCILFFTQRKKINELEKSFRQQIKDIQYQQRNSRDNKAIQRDAVEHRSNDRGAQDLLSQAAVKTDIGKKQTSIGQNPKTETVRPKSTGYTEQSNDMRSALYFSEAEREKWLSLNPNYSCLKVPESIRNRLFAGEKLSFREIALTPSGNMNNALFILLDDKDVYLNFWLYNAERELPADIERSVKLVYDFDQPLPRYVKTCQPALVRKTNNGYIIQQKGKIWLA